MGMTIKAGTISKLNVNGKSKFQVFQLMDVPNLRLKHLTIFLFLTFNV